ncbi:MAG: hypothetical protein ACLFTO_06205 [Candidatus Acetothermia bacterium]
MALVTVISPGVNAETSFRNTELKAAVNELAEMNGKKVIFSTRPEGKVNTVLEGEDFEGALSQLLSGTPYQFTKKSSYYLVGKFERGTLEFASHSERLIYKPRYLPAEELDSSLTLPNVRTEVLDETDHLLIQGLPKDIEKAKQELARLDSEDNPYQVRYELTIVDITKRKEDKFELSAAEIASDADGPVEFIASEQAMELLSGDILEFIDVTARTSNERSKSVARPSLVTALGETGSFSFSRESIYSETWNTGMEAAGIEASLTPIRKSRPQNEVKTEISLQVSGKSELNTTTWLEPEKRSLLGLLKFKRSAEKIATSSELSDEEEKTFALYIKAIPVGTLPADGQSGNREPTQNSSLEGSFSPSIDMNGVGQLLFPEQENAFSSVKGDLQFLSDGRIDFSLEGSETSSGIEFTRGGTDSYLNLSMNFPINSALNWKGEYIRDTGGGQRAVLGVTDEFDFNSGWTLGITYYPLVFQPAKGVLEHHEGLVQLGYSSNPVFMEVQYGTEIFPARLRAEVGVKLPTSFYLVGSAVGDSEGFNRYLAGLRVRF